MTEVRQLWRGEATLGEGPAWDSRRGVLWFVDIKQRHVLCYSPRDGEVQRWAAPAQVGWVLPTAGETLLTGLQTGLALFDPRDGSFTHRADVEGDLPGNRLNDATVAQDGSVWFGSMDDRETAVSGRFYRWDGNRVVDSGLSPVAITNGPCLSPANDRLYHVDTIGGRIDVATLDKNGAVECVEEFARIDPADGHPDGVSIDSAGNVWLGLWGGWRARLYSPTGEILREVRLPASNVTKVALGGPDLTTAYVTTARAGLTDAQLAEQPDAGSLFAFDVDVPGLPLPPARL
ncbi:gluconolaconase [Aurantiacibacter luteus]|uniref:Gluconolaconase n=2 Tax=Aurantiacibacter luteus TaxID=1581420 RepID=A0A0G9MZG9_9SPHN|nr:gluconolaconase [Aurantiacibacter luteus]